MLEPILDTAGEIVFTHDVSSWKSVDLAEQTLWMLTKIFRRCCSRSYE